MLSMKQHHSKQTIILTIINDDEIFVSPCVLLLINYVYIKIKSASDLNNREVNKSDNFIRLICNGVKVLVRC
jgi:hypothetical protein